MADVLKDDPEATKRTLALIESEGSVEGGNVGAPDPEGPSLADRIRERIAVGGDRG